MDYQIKNEQLSVSISTNGAQLLSIQKQGQEYLWSADPKIWADHAPVLFPYVGRLTKGEYQYQGKEYSMDIHGFAKDMEFQVLDVAADTIRLQLEDTPQTFENYPFHFTFTIQYQLIGSRLEMIWQVQNKGQNTMYFGLGGHPGFGLPFEEGLDFTDYYLEFGQKCMPDRIGFTEACFLNGRDDRFVLEEGQKLLLRHELFDQDAIFLKNMASQVTLKSDKGSRKVTVTYPAMPYLGLWHMPKTQAPYVCIEPWCSLPSRQDVIEDIACKSDLIRLEKQKSYETIWSIKIE